MRPDFGPHFLITTDAEATTGAFSVQLDEIDGIAIWDVETPGFSPSEVAELHCVVCKRDCDYSVLDDYTVTFTHDEMHGPWLIRTPDQFSLALASLDDSELESVGELWWQSSRGFQFRETPVDWVKRLTFRLVKLAKQAVEQSKHLYFEVQSC